MTEHARRVLTNSAVAVYPVKVIRTRRRNPLRDELYDNTPQFQEIVAQHKPIETGDGVLRTELAV
ncbi:hypothetical protein [Bowdeniella massiliensis]|uniref:hypothetical protein n=1 Tax=Bowdeniella massiliensis TaxID=2932264 RepID=UPI0020283706|nr:hypothetical protein [Bowdeniella massiliensis]